MIRSEFSESRDVLSLEGIRSLKLRDRVMGSEFSENRDVVKGLETTIKGSDGIRIL